MTDQIKDWGTWVEELNRLAQLAPDNYFFAFFVSCLDVPVAQPGNVAIITNASDTKELRQYLKVLRRDQLREDRVRRVVQRRAAKA